MSHFVQRLGIILFSALRAHIQILLRFLFIEDFLDIFKFLFWHKVLLTGRTEKCMFFETML